MCVVCGALELVPPKLLETGWEDRLLCTHQQARRDVSLDSMVFMCSFEQALWLGRQLDGAQFVPAWAFRSFLCFVSPVRSGTFQR